MRLDKFLKVSRIIKRRIVAKEIALHDKIFVNNRLAKPSTILKIGDKITIAYKDKTLSLKVISLTQHPVKDQSESMYELIENHEIPDQKLFRK